MEAIAYRDSDGSTALEPQVSGDGTNGEKLGAPKKLHFSVPKKLLGAKGIATRSKDTTRGSWP